MHQAIVATVNAKMMEAAAAPPAADTATAETKQPDDAEEPAHKKLKRIDFRYTK